jgi:hypothetical protein
MALSLLSRSYGSTNAGNKVVIRDTTTGSLSTREIYVKGLTVFKSNTATFSEMDTLLQTF